jgi:HK97 family phage prohead protease
MTMNVERHPSRHDALVADFAGGVKVRVADGAKPVIDYVGSDDSEDRYGSIIDPRGWQLSAYLKNPTVLWAHDYSLPPVGRALTVTKTARALNFRVEFAVFDSFAARVFELVRNGFLSGCSVGFLPLAAEEYESSTVPQNFAENKKYTKVELLELSVVPVPANRTALKNAFASGSVSRSTVARLGLTEFLDGAPFPIQAQPKWTPKKETLQKLDDIYMHRRMREIAARWKRWSEQ